MRSTNFIEKGRCVILSIMCDFYLQTNFPGSIFLNWLDRNLKSCLTTTYTRKIVAARSRSFVTSWPYPGKGRGTLSRTGYKKRTGQFIRALHVYSIPYARHHNPLLIINRSWILTIHKGRNLQKKLLKKRFWPSKVG